jgi:glycosyltransferase involved in cell wall biosynthesis
MVSIIIAHYNRAHLLVKNLELISLSAKNNFEFIIIEDCSKREDFNILLDSQSIFKFKLIRNKINRGPGYSRNIGLFNASGDYVLFLDSDDMINLNLINEQCIYSKNNCDIFIFNTAITNLSSTVYSYDNFILENLLSFLKRDGDSISPIPTACLLFKRTFLIDNCLYFPTIYRKSEDTIFKLRVLLRYPILCDVKLSQPFFVRNITVDSLTRNISRYKRILNRFFEFFSGLDLFFLSINNKKVSLDVSFKVMFRSIIKLFRL